MKKNYMTLFVLLFIFCSARAEQHNIITSGFTFSPNLINAAVGDTINFPGSGLHPVVQVDQATWNVNGTTPLPGGFGPATAPFMYVIQTMGDIYYICQNHGPSMGMKGSILVTPSNVAEMIGNNNVKIVSTMVSFNEVSVLNSTGKSGAIHIYDLSGKELFVKPLTAEARQQVEINFPSGVLLYRFNMEGTWTETEKLYIEK